MDLSFLSPLDWGSEPFIALIALALILRVVLPRPATRYQRIAQETLAIGPAVFLYFLIRGFVNARDEQAFANAQRIIDLEQALGIYYEADLQNLILDSNLAVNIVNWVYIWAHWPLIAAVVIWLVVYHARDYPLYRNAMLLSGASGMLMFATFPVAPPRLMETLDVVDTVTQRSGSYRVLQPPGLTNPYAAMPSLHFGWNLLMGIAIYRQTNKRWFKVFGIIMPAAMFSAIVLTANHYFLDGVVGGMIVLASLLMVSSGTEAGRAWWRRHPVPGARTAASRLPFAAEALLPERRPLVIAHRAGNDLTELRRAEAAGADVVEADIWLFRNQLEVRHTKTMGPIPLLWDRWSLHSARAPRMLLHDLLQAARPDTLLMLDLKGRDPEVSRRIIAELREHAPDRPVLVCSQNWNLLAPFRFHEQAIIVHSIGNSWQLRNAWEHLASDTCDALSIQYQLLDDERVALLRERVPLIFTWAINSSDRYQQVTDWGLDGAITDDLAIIPARSDVSERQPLGQAAG